MKRICVTVSTMLLCKGQRIRSETYATFPSLKPNALLKNGCIPSSGQNKGAASTIMTRKSSAFLISVEGFKSRLLVLGTSTLRPGQRRGPGVLSGGSYPFQIAALCGLKSPEPVACLTLTIERHPLRNGRLQIICFAARLRSLPLASLSLPPGRHQASHDEVIALHQRHSPTILFWAS
jgi:hypothetical protein